MSFMSSSTIRTPPQLSAADQAAACKSTPNKVGEVQAALAACRNSTEDTRVGTLLDTVSNARGKFESEEAVYQDLIVTGDSIFGTTTTDTQIADIRARNAELKKMKSGLLTAIKSAASRAEQANRDFIDTKEALPETLPRKMLRTLEDYTVAVFMLAYLFMGLSLVYLYVAINGFSGATVLTALLVFGVVSIVLGVLMYRFL